MPSQMSEWSRARGVHYRTARARYHAGKFPGPGVYAFAGASGYENVTVVREIGSGPNGRRGRRSARSRASTVLAAAESAL